MSSPSNPPPPLRIAVVGGGIAGLTSALALLNAKSRNGANIDIQVYESAVRPLPTFSPSARNRDADSLFPLSFGRTQHEFAEIGAGVSFGPNAQRALSMLGLAEVLAGTSHLH